MSQTIGITLANLLMVAHLAVLVLYRGQRSVHELVARTMVMPGTDARNTGASQN